MSMMEGGEPSAAAEASQPETPRTAGAMLKAAREARGLHIAALAAMLKVPQAKLELLESDRWHELPDATFARALAKAVCRTLKVDATPVLALLPRGDERELQVSLGINAPYRERGEVDRGLSPAALMRPVVLVPLVLLLAAAGVYLMPAHLVSDIKTAVLPASAPTTVAAASEAASEPASEPASDAAPAFVSAPVASAPVAEVPVLTHPSAAAASAPASANAPRALTAVTAPAPASHVVASGEQVPVIVKTSADSWVQIVDATGATLVSRLVPAGSEEDLAGTPPLKVTIGNVGGTQLLLRGQIVDLAARSQNNVARLELN